MSDHSYMREYGLATSRMQVKWCGFGWSDSDIERRLEATKNSFVQYEFSAVTRNTFSAKISNEEGYVKTEKLSCSIRRDQRLECKRASG